ncbi:MAG TPA: PRC-barrel domain-containing protein, partial [Chloroflexota bacterium]|nr:PRC-barrel domain-containing protein [Chloroflexota bacterium]
MEAMRSTERIDPGDDVLGSDGEKLGTVAYVVARPPEMKVTDIVVSTGALLGRDIVVPIDKVANVADQKVTLSIDKDQLKALPDYVDVRYKEPPVGWVPPAGYLYPAGTMLWPAEMYFPEEASVKVNAPAGTVGVSKGMDVESSDGHKVGTIDGLYLDPQADEVTALIVKHG